MYKGVAKLALIGVTILTIVSVVLLSFLEFDYDFESFFPTDDPDLDFYLEYRDNFEPDNDFVLVAITSNDGVFNSRFLNKVDTLAQRLNDLEHIESVLSPTNATNPVVGPMGPIQVPFIHLSRPELYSKDSVRIFETEWLRNTLFSEDRRSVCMVLQTEPRLSKEASDSLVFDMKDILGQYTFERLRITGRVEGQQYFIEKIKWEMAMFMTAGLFLLTIFLFVAFRSFWGIWVPILVVALSAVWLLGVMSAAGKTVDAMVTLLPTILFVVGMSDVVHILSRYLEELRNGKEKIAALKIAFREVGMATFLTSLTTAIGFFTLLTSSIRPIREFGIYTGIGVFLAFILAFTLLPALLVFFKRPKIAETTNDGLFWHRRMHGLFAWVLNKRKWILLGGVLTVGISLWGLSLVKIDNYLLGDLQDTDPHKQDFLFFEDQFSGVRPFEMSVSVPDSNRSVLDFPVLLEMKKIEDYLTAEYGIGFMVSPVSLVKSANQAMHGGKTAYYRMPESEKEYKRIKSVIKQLKKQSNFRAYFTEDLHQARISGKMVDLGSYKIKRMTEKLKLHLDETLDSDLIAYKVTGMAMLIDKSNETLSGNMMNGLLIAFGVIALIMGLLYRSGVIILVSLVPNILPLLVIGGYMGFAGVDLQVSTSIIFTIAFGIAVDDTIHYMSKLRLELNKGKSLLYALKRTSISTGKAITVTTLILCSGFVTLLLSAFSSTYHIGLLICLTLVFAVIADLLLLPVLLLFLYRPKTKKKQ